MHSANFAIFIFPWKVFIDFLNIKYKTLGIQIKWEFNCISFTKDFLKKKLFLKDYVREQDD